MSKNTRAGKINSSKYREQTILKREIGANNLAQQKQRVSVIKENLVLYGTASHEICAYNQEEINSLMISGTINQRVANAMRRNHMEQNEQRNNAELDRQDEQHKEEHAKEFFEVENIKKILQEADMTVPSDLEKFILELKENIENWITAELLADEITKVVQRAYKKHMEIIPASQATTTKATTTEAPATQRQAAQTPAPQKETKTASQLRRSIKRALENGDEIRAQEYQARLEALTRQAAQASTAQEPAPQAPAPQATTTDAPAAQEPPAYPITPDRIAARDSEAPAAPIQPDQIQSAPIQSAQEESRKKAHEVILVITPKTNEERKAIKQAFLKKVGGIDKFNSIMKDAMNSYTRRSQIAKNSGKLPRNNSSE